MKLTYWMCRQQTDSGVFNLRAKTKKGVLELRASAWNSKEFGEPEKMVIEYRDAFDLLTILRSEDCSNY